LAKPCGLWLEHELATIAIRVTIMVSKLCGLGLAVVAAFASTSVSNVKQDSQPTIAGEYIEIRSCDVYTGSCFANAEMTLTGHEAIMAWSVRNGELDGVKLDGLNVVAVVQADGTLGDVQRYPRRTRSVLIVDEAANPAQREALAHLARQKAGDLLGVTVAVEATPIRFELPATCSESGCANMRAGDLVEIQTRCLGGQDHVCGNEELFYPPLTSVNDPRPAFTVAAVYRGPGLGTQFDEANRRSAYLATFAN
jgi:hypothetical protein